MSILDPDSGELVPDNATQPFPNPGEIALDHVTEATGEIASQYSQAARLIATVTAFAAAAQKIEDCAVAIPPLDAVVTDNPSSTVNVNLDVTGDLVGQSRVLADGTVETNAVFVTLIELRILRNSSIASSPQYMAAVMAILGSTPFRYIDFGGMSVGIELATGAAPSADEIALLSDAGPIPRAMGVGVGREWYDPAEYFAFDDDPGSGAKGFGELGDPTQGGDFAELF